MENKKSSNAVETAIFAMMVIIGIGIIFNQTRMISMSANFYLNMLSFILIFVLMGLVAMIAMKKELDRAAKSDAESRKERVPMSLMEKTSVGLIAIVGIMIVLNQIQISGVNAAVSGSGSDFSRFIKSMSLKSASSLKGGVIVGPQMNPDGRTTKLVEWPTISDTPAPEDTGNPTQDAINYVVPRGTPFYILEGPGIEKIKGASFDDPLTSQKVWASLLGSRRFGTANRIDLTPEEQARWDRIVDSFTCDYCCGGPNSVTPIKNCGCAHSYAWQGMAKFFIRYYPQYTDEQIAGEMTKWKGLWYPQGMIQDYLVYTGQQPASILTHGGSVGIKQQFLQQGSGNNQDTQASAVPLSELPSMVGGC